MTSKIGKYYYIVKIMNKEDDKMKLKFNLPSPSVRRNDLGKLTEGLLNPKTIRNLDSQGKGIKGKFFIGPRTVAYPTEEVFAFIEARISEFYASNKEKCEVYHDDD